MTATRLLATGLRGDSIRLSLLAGLRSVADPSAGFALGAGSLGWLDSRICWLSVGAAYQHGLWERDGLPSHAPFTGMGLSVRVVRSRNVVV